MKSNKQGIETLTIRRATVADADKVRYRVYSTPTEFIAVIAESALMAVKVSGVSKPHKIVRDLPTEGIAVGAKKMETMDANAARISLPISRTDAKQQLVAEIAIQSSPEKVKEASFKPMTIGDLQHKGMARARILPPEMVSEIIEQHAKTSMPPMPTQEAEKAPDPAPPLDPKEKLMQMAQEMPTSAEEAKGEDKILTPDEVEKLLNGS